MMARQSNPHTSSRRPWQLTIEAQQGAPLLVRLSHSRPEDDTRAAALARSVLATLTPVLRELLKEAA
jgi:hypothetical protein